MKKLLFFIILSSLKFNAISQYNVIKVSDDKIPELTIKQIDQYDFSTVIHFTYQSISTLKFSGSEDIILKNNNNTFRLLNSYNLPLDDKKHVFNETGEFLNFSLEFEKIDNINMDLQLSGTESKYFNISKIEIDSLSKTSFLDLNSFISQTPSREFYLFYNEGAPVLKYAYKGIILAIKLTYNEEFGQYFQPQIVIQNYNKKDILLDPANVFAQYQVNGKYFNALVIGHKKYLAVVKKKQSNERFLTGLVDGLATIGAGYSYISANSNTYVTANGKSLNYGFLGNNLYASQGQYSASASISTNVSGYQYDASKTIMAAQIAKQNMENLKAEQVQKLNSLQSGYIKLNTIFTNSDYVGYANIPFAKNADGFLMKININGNEFFFEWNEKQLKDLF